MQLKHSDSNDLIGRALQVAVSAVQNGNQDHPMTPALFWQALQRDGFHFVDNPPGSDEHGRFFAHLVLDHALAERKIAGNAELHHYWSV